MTEEAAITVTLKAGEGYDAPWVVVRADNPEEARQRVSSAGLLAAVAAASVDLQGAYAASKGLGARPIEQTFSSPVFNADPGTAPAGQVVQFPVPHTPILTGAGSTQGAPQGALDVRTDRYNNKYTYGVPGAPTCPHGTRVLKQGTKRDGQPYTSYVCPQMDGAFRVQSECKAIYQ